MSVEHYIQHSRPLRLAIDISIWLFQIQSGKGGSNPALRTFYYRLLRLLSLNIHPLFVFDGPNKPPFKRNKRVGGPNVKVSSIPEFLAKQLLKQFGFPMHAAPGEAEAECALLQREGIVDAVLSEDVDTLMFGSGVTLRSWTPELKSSKVPTHVNVYDARVTKEGSGLDRGQRHGGLGVCQAPANKVAHCLVQLQRRPCQNARSWNPHRSIGGMFDRDSGEAVNAWRGGRSGCRVYPTCPWSPA